MPALILSGGEPLLRPDIFEISERAKKKGFYVGLSTNGALIDHKNIGELPPLATTISASRSTHRRDARPLPVKPGCFEASLNGIRLARAAGIKVGLRFTVTHDNHAELGDVMELAAREGVDKFYLSHLVYAGRGNKIAQMTRRSR